MYDLRSPDYVPPHLRATDVQKEEKPSKQPPAWAGETRSRVKHPLDSMDVNDTYRIPPEPGRLKFISLQVHCSQRGKELGKQFRCKELPDGTFEVWRKA